MDSAYVTRYNFKRISSFWLQPECDTSIDKIFSIIYEKSLSFILNHQEATRLYVQKLMLQGTLDSLRLEPKKFNSDFVLKVGPPKFHKNEDCEFLKSDFFNYLVPPTISALAEDKIRDFKDLCESHRKSLGEFNDAFWARVGLKFNVHIAPEHVDYKNSGITNIEKMSIEFLLIKINENIEKNLKAVEGNGSGRPLQRLRYAPSLKFALTKVSNEEEVAEIKNFFKSKSDLIEMLFELYRKQAKYNEYILPVHLLKTCGLEPCRGCWK